MKLDTALLGRLLNVLQDEARLVSYTFRERGTNRFVRPIVLGAFCVGVCYTYLYVPPVKKMKRLDKAVAAAKVASIHADRYKAMRERLLAVYAELPAREQRATWLTDTVVESMKAENLTSDSIQPPDETMQSHFISQKVTVTSRLKFAEIFSWLYRLEGVKPQVQLSSLEVIKGSSEIGINQVACGIMVAIPERSLAP